MKTIKTIGAVLGAILIIGIIYLFFADFGSYKPEIEAACRFCTKVRWTALPPKAVSARR